MDSNGLKNCDVDSQLALFEVISNKWTPLVLLVLRSNKKRYSQIHRELNDISPKVLTQTLRILERNGLITRKVFPVVPPHVEYAVSAHGLELIKILDLFGSWASTYAHTTLDARKSYDTLSLNAQSLT